MSLFRYSGLSAKIHAMEAHMLKVSDYKTMCSISTVKELALYLESCPGYAKQISLLTEENLNRVQIEKQLMISMYDDFVKIYRFTSSNDKSFLNMYMILFEVNIIKMLLRMQISQKPLSYELSDFKGFFEKHSKIDINKLLKVSDINEFVESFKETEYYNILSMLVNTKNINLFDVEMRLDMYCYLQMWKLKDKFLSKAGKSSIESVIGTEADLLNIMWIYRAKNNYKIDNEIIYAYLLPLHYKLKNSQIKSLIEAKNNEEFQRLVKETAYSKATAEFYDKGEKDVEKLLFRTLSRLQAKAVRNYPMSLAPVKYYMYRKNTEISNITKIVEGIRYNLSPEEIMSYLNISERKGGYMA